MTVITFKEYQAYKTNFARGRSTTDYVVRCFAVGDEEELQVVENTFIGKWEVFSFHTGVYKSLKAELPTFVALRVGVLVKFGRFKIIVRLLEPYISNKTLYRKSFLDWENIYFASSYADYKRMRSYG